MAANHQPQEALRYQKSGDISCPAWTDLAQNPPPRNIKNIKKQGPNIPLLPSFTLHAATISYMSFHSLFRRGPLASTLTSLTSSLLRPVPRRIRTPRVRLPASRSYATTPPGKTKSRAALLASIGGAGAIFIGAIFWFLVRIPTPPPTTHH